MRPVRRLSYTRRCCCCFEVDVCCIGQAKRLELYINTILSLETGNRVQRGARCVPRLYPQEKMVPPRCHLLITVEQLHLLLIGKSVDMLRIKITLIPKHQSALVANLEGDRS